MSTAPIGNTQFSDSTDKLGKHDTEMIEMPSVEAGVAAAPKVDRFGTVLELDEAQRLLRRKIDFRISESSHGLSDLRSILIEQCQCYGLCSQSFKMSVGALVDRLAF
jgi:hypothetical protein